MNRTQLCRQGARLSPKAIEAHQRQAQCRRSRLYARLTRQVLRRSQVLWEAKAPR